MLKTSEIVIIEVSDFGQSGHSDVRYKVYLTKKL